MSWRRLIVWGGLFLTIVAGLAYAFRPQPVLVDLVTLSRGPMTVTIDEEGMTRVRDVYVLSAPVAGRVRRIDGDVGDAVVAGETVVTRIEPIDPSFLDMRSRARAEAAVRAASASLALARAELEQAEAEFDFASAEVERARRLRRDKTISERGLEDAERLYRTRRAAVEMARSELEIRRFQLDNARAQLLSPVETVTRHEGCECIPIVAPVDGEILSVVHESEGVVNAGEPLVEIGDPADLEIVADFLSPDVVQIEPGQRVIIGAWGGEPVTGKVRRVEPAGFTKVSALGIEEQRVNVVIDFDASASPARRLGHGFRVEVRVVLWEDDDVLKLPLTALFRDGARWAVYVEQGGRARLRHVQIGHRNRREAEIVGGLEEGVRIVLHPGNQVTENTRIAARS